MSKKLAVRMRPSMLRMFAAVLVFATAPSPAARSTHPVRLNFVCASPEALARSQVQSVVRELMSTRGEEGSRAWGDRAVAVDLNHDSHPEFLVPLSCGGTCNCTWGIVAEGPPRSLGVIEGCVLEFVWAKDNWISVRSYSHYS